MRRRILRIILYCIFVGSFIVLAWVWRAPARNKWFELWQPSVPETAPQAPSVSLSVLSSTAQVSDAPSAVPGSAAMPAEFNLFVPFLSQAPLQDWRLPYQEACEEASVLMAAAFARREQKGWSPSEGSAEILKLVEWEKSHFGFYEDTTLAQTREILARYFLVTSTFVIKNPLAAQLRQEIAKGNIILAPAYGKALPNPHFRNGGPLYHMLVVKGYTSNGFITNDPGTQFGRNFFYKDAALINAMHDWNNGDVVNGEKAVLVVEKMKNAELIRVRNEE